jgi:hypothetical protein
MNDENATPNSQIVLAQAPKAPMVVERPNVGKLVRRTIFDLNELELSRLKLMAQMYAASSFNNSKYPQKEGDFFLIMLKGIELGIMPMAAVDSINIIAGKPVLDAKGMLGLVKSSGLLEDIEIDSNAGRCIVTIKRIGNSEQIVGFSMEDAKTYKTMEWVDGKKIEISLSEKSNWKSQPEVMLTWRCVMKALRLVFPDIVLGMLTPEEMDTDNTIVHADGSMEYTPPVVQKALPAKTEISKSEQPAESAASSTPKAWHEDVEALKKVLADCREKGWIEGDTLNKAKSSFASLVGSEITSFETIEAASKAAEEAATKAKEANAKSGEAWDTFEGVQAIVTWAKGKGFGDSEPALIALLGKDWKAFADGRSAKEAIEEAFKAKQAMPPAENISKKTKLTDIDMLAISEWVKTHFGITASVLVERVDLSKCSTIATAKTVIRGDAREQGWPVMTEQVTYTVKKDGNNGEKKSLRFETVLGEISYFKGRTEFSKVVGEGYANDNGIPELPANEANDIEPLLLTWKARENYNEVVDAIPVLEPELA